MVVVVVDKTSKLLLFDGGGQSMDNNEQVGGDRIEIEELREGPTNEHVIVEGFGKERRYSHEGVATAWRMMGKPHFTSRW